MRKQRGVTMIGWIILLIPVAIVLYAGIRVGPEYMDYYKVVTAMKETASALESDETLSPQSIRSSLQKRFDTSYVENVKSSEVVISKIEGGWEMTAEYEAQADLFGNLSILLDFSKTVAITPN
jgi:hypothetical protein